MPILNRKKSVYYQMSLTITSLLAGWMAMTITVNQLRGVTKTTGKQPDLIETSQVFRDLRKVKGHFDGAHWNSQADQWMGEKHRVMLRIEDLVMANQITKPRLLKLLGKPDVISQKGEKWFTTVFDGNSSPYGKNRDVELYIFFWRTQHDLLYFLLNNQRILKSGWWYARE